MATQVSETSGKSRARAGDELAVIAQRAQAFTNASGTAIALSEGNADEIICRARSGASAPDVGTTMRVEGSFTGLCIQSGKELRCDDAETDTRVDTAAIRALGIRSMVVTPIKEENRVVGVLAVFAPTPHAFTITHVAVLKTMADQIAILLQKERRAREEGREPEPARLAPSVNIPKPVASAPVVPPAVVVKPAAPAPRASFPVVSRVEPIKAAPVAEEIAAPLPLPKKEEKRAEQKFEPRTTPSFEPASGEVKPAANRNMIVAIAAAVVVLGGGTFAYLKMRTPSQTPQHTQEIAAVPASTQPNAVAPGATTSTQPSAANNPAPAASAPAPVATAPTKPVSDTSAADAARRAAAERAAAERAAARNNNSNSSSSNNTPPPQPEKHAPAAVELSNGGASKIAGAQGNAQPSADVAPVLMVNNTNAPGALSSLARPVAASTPTVISHSDLEPAQVVKKVAPVYPAIAKARRLSGNAIVQATVGPDGKITNLQFVSGLPVFKEAAFDAMKQCQFKPARLNGQAIEQAIQIRFDFRPN